MASPYDDAMAVIVESIKSQMAWPSARMLGLDLHRAFTLLHVCPKCGEAMTHTASAPIVNAPMAWRCFACVELGNVSSGPIEGIIEINELGQVYPSVKGPIRDG
jgi:predicted RNA-binding Zn-ribbon protein involved in translation (DUF1610 family)